MTHLSTSFDVRRFERVRWATYAILILAYMSVFFHRMAPAVVSAELMTTFHTTGAALGSLAAMYYLAAYHRNGRAQYNNERAMNHTGSEIVLSLSVGLGLKRLSQRKMVSHCAPF